MTFAKTISLLFTNSPCEITVKLQQRLTSKSGRAVCTTNQCDADVVRIRNCRCGLQLRRQRFLYPLTHGFLQCLHLAYWKKY